MENISKPSPEILKHAVMELQEPVLFQDLLRDSEGAYTWKLLQWNLVELNKKFGDKGLPFRVGHNTGTKEPQWEANCPINIMSFSEFVQKVNSSENDELWYYFDYKYMHEWLSDRPEIMTSLNWSRFGFDKSGDDTTLWIGSKGAHTNCHQDSYGCNLVAQICGRKQWLLFPPTATKSLRPIRVPYEESTIYSKYNFFSLMEKDIEIVSQISDKVKLITLEAGDVLLVPQGWWHYVESLDLSISVNVWLPLVSDCQARVKEALVNLLVSTIGENVPDISAETQRTLPYCMELVSAAINECKNTKKTNVHCEKKVKSTTWTVQDLCEEYPTSVRLLKTLDKSELRELLEGKRKRFEKSTDNHKEDESLKKAVDVRPSYQGLSENVINAFCHPDIISKVAEVLLNLENQ
ncbi:hypothetical protein KM043_009833 [Ampulex compressa]|nr:hypothetical protein KM043_009833 [Ampulex compressa]